ncbi:MAG TPA: GNAT family N-acetyltransferase [Variovorax sp.]
METTNAAASLTSIRRARPKDAKGIETLYGELVGSTHVCVLPERIAELENDSRTALLVLEHGGALRATALLNFCADVMYKAQPFAVVENIVVSQAFRGQGAGTALLQHIENECVARDCSKIMLLSAVERGEAHRFFERCGFAGSKKKGFVKYRKNFRSNAEAGPDIAASKT